MSLRNTQKPLRSLLLTKETASTIVAVASGSQPSSVITASYDTGLAAPIVSNKAGSIGASGIVAQVAPGTPRGIAPLACQQDSFTLTSTFQDISPYLDFHQDFFHPGSQLNENIILRGCTVDHEGYTWVNGGSSNWALTFFRVAGVTSLKDVMLLDNACDQAQSAFGAYSVAAASHLYEAGTSYGTWGYAIPNTGDAYTFCDNNVSQITWAIGTVAPPYAAQRGNYFTSVTNGTTSAAFPGSYNSNNTLVLFSGETARAAGQAALFADHVNGDFRPSGALAATLLPRSHSNWDQRGFARATNDAAGAVSVNAPAPAWPFA